MAARAAGIAGIVLAGLGGLAGDLAAQAPTVTGLSVNSPADSTYVPGDTIEATVTFNKAVDVTGTPQLALGIASGTKQADYVSGTGTRELVFQYEVASGDSDADGISVGSAALGLNSGTINTAGAAAVLDLQRFEIINNAGHKVVGSYTAVAVSGLSITSVPPVANTYGRDGGDRVGGDVQPAGGRGDDGRDAAAGAGDRREHAAGGVHERHGDEGADVPVRGGGR